jgi:hypothetical protein
MATKKAAKKSAKAAPKKIARQKNLPGMTDRKIQGIENAALRYVEVRDARMELSQQEIKEKGLLMDLLHKHKIKKYKRGNIDIELVVEKEKVRVRVKNDSSDDDLEAGNDAEVASGESESADLDEGFEEGSAEEMDEEEEG